jgi:hypothetical protein
MDRITMQRNPMSKPAAALACLFFSLSCQGADVASFGKPRQVEDVSLVSLIANPDNYDGKPVRVTGAFRLEFEGNVICLHQDDLRYRINRNCLWIEPDFKALDGNVGTLSALNGQYVLLEGSFRKDNHGHRGRSSGAITGVWRVMAEQPAH